MHVGRRTLKVFLLLLVGAIPFGGGTVLAVSASSNQAQAALDLQLQAMAQVARAQLMLDLDRFARVMLTAADNPAFLDIERDPGHRARRKHEVDQGLFALNSAFPGMIDEACRINAHGTELGRVVHSAVAPDQDLSSDEGSTPFFAPTLALARGRVRYQAPYVSPDSERWVLAVTTPLYESTVNHGLLHFEVPLAFYHQMFTRDLPPGGFVALVSPGGEVYMTTDANEPGKDPFAHVRSLSDGPEPQQALEAALAGRSDFVAWQSGGHRFRVHYELVEPASGFPMVMLVGLPAVPGLLG